MFTVEGLADAYECLGSPYPRIGTGEIYIHTRPGGLGGVEGVTFDLIGGDVPVEEAVRALAR